MVPFPVNLAGLFKKQGPVASTAPYRGGEIHRLNKTWQPENFSGDAAISEGWELLTRRIRDLDRNDPAIGALGRALLDNIIGTGILTTAAVRIAEGELDDEFNAESDELAEEWEAEADVTGRLAWPEMQRQLFGETLHTGEVLLLRCAKRGADRLCPLCYQILEAEQLDANMDREAGRGQTEIKRGIEFARDGTPIAYWLFDRHPGDTHTAAANSKRILADRVTHLQLPGRPSQTRGISLYRSITQSAKDLDNYLGAELTAANIGALFTLLHKSGSPGSGMGFVGDGTEADGTDEYGNARVKLGRGITCHVGKEDEVEMIEAKRPNRDAGVFTRLILMLMSMGGNVSPYRLTRDYSGTTYVAARAAHLDDRAAFRPMQGLFGRKVCLPVRRELTRQLVGLGLIRSIGPRQFLAQPRRWSRIELQPPGWEEIDPIKEVTANNDARRGGQRSLKEICAARGKNWRRVIDQIAVENAYAAKRGVTIDAAGSNPAVADAARDEKEEEAPAK
ncbi:MAG TPA: phage portal protein [Thermoguttaceae bacterium]|nr:phage portal protein [Thermoguttaceae bacterium]HUX16053.1 phage portal protein [Phycisphaerae bacterium]